MKIARYAYQGKEKYGSVESDLLKIIEGDIFDEFEVTDKKILLRDIRILPPVIPSKIVAVGLNYAKHVTELVKDRKAPKAPLLFMKPSTSVIGPEENIIRPLESNEVHYEGELAVVMKKRAKKIGPEEVKSCILGYTCLNDVTARDWQREDGQWTRGKSFDTFCPIGPVIVTDIENPNNLKIETRLNGEVKQSSSTSYLLFKVEELVSYISKHMTLLPGDIIATGTPEGVGPMVAGDRVEVEIENIGVLRNYVTNEI
jgi:2-keto-4-pentenoate hydratase/2-oxohepta-3-ene-1,7-dioic acid hydratase in catechol pathway